MSADRMLVDRRAQGQGSELGNRTLCDFYRERANFAIELCRRQWQSARALDDFLRMAFSTVTVAFHGLQPYIRLWPSYSLMPSIA